MAGKRRRGKRRIGAGGVILALLAALTLSAAGIYAMYMLGSSRPAPEEKLPSAAVRETALSLFTAPESESNPAPIPAAAPAVGADAAEYDYNEILFDQDGLLVAKILGKRYMGYIAVIDDPLRLEVGRCPYFDKEAAGRRVSEMADAAGAVLAVNGGGFLDIGGVGLGGLPIGNVVKDGRLHWGEYSATVGMDASGKLYAGEYSGNYCVRDLGLQWALAYGPVLVTDGVIRPDLNAVKQEPRTAVGQRADGTVVIVVLQGRQMQTLGVTCLELAQIMVSYGCVTAGNLDGGASSDMYFQGKYLNVCNTSGGPRPIPTCLMVMPPREQEG